MNKLSFIILGIILTFPNVAYGYTQKHTTGGRLVSWKRSQVDITVIRTDACSCPSRTDVIGSLERAATTWNETPTAPHINITERSGNPEWGIDGINGVYLVEDWPFSFRALAVTLTTYNDDTGELIDTDIIINGELPFSLSGERNKYDLDTVLTHELGHVLGLDESEVRSATMFPDTRIGETDRRQLSTDDIDGILYLYNSQTMPAIGCNITIGRGSFRQGIFFLMFFILKKRILKLLK
jgi:hypothetical protein